jgi:lipopolysaccharide biosynthesis regulator YciM
LFLELKDSQSYREASLEGLCSIYQQEKEWAKAIEVSRMHKRSSRSQYSQRIAHYWCELAEQSIANKQFDDARKYLRSALSEDRAAARAVLLNGELSFQKKNYQKALSLWLSLSVNNPSLAAIVVEKIILCYRELDDSAELKEYLLHVASIPKDEKAFDLWRGSMIEEFGDSATLEQLLEQARREGISGPVADYLYCTTENDTFSSKQKSLLLQDMLGRAKIRKIEYTCSGCGFDTKAMHWFCVNCGEWDSFS